MTVYEKRRILNIPLGVCAQVCGLASWMMSRVETGRVELTPEITKKLSELLQMTEEEVKAGIPTKEEYEKDESIFYDMVEALKICKDDAKSKGLRKGNGGQGSVACPICKGTLLYIVANYNGHMHGNCNTAGCVSWME